MFYFIFSILILWFIGGIISLILIFVNYLFESMIGLQYKSYSRKELTIAFFYSWYNVFLIFDDFESI